VSIALGDSFGVLQTWKNSKILPVRCFNRVGRFVWGATESGLINSQMEDRFNRVGRFVWGATQRFGDECAGHLVSIALGDSFGVLQTWKNSKILPVRCFNRVGRFVWGATESGLINSQMEDRFNRVGRFVWGATQRFGDECAGLAVSIALGDSF